ncbi:Alpha/beta hydrolase [Balamuthia mandrillaris]
MERKRSWVALPHTAKRVAVLSQTIELPFVGFATSNQTKTKPIHIFFVHGNGLCKEVWLPVIDRLLSLLLQKHQTQPTSKKTPHGRTTSFSASTLSLHTIDLEGHGESDPFAPELLVWWDFGRDVAAVVRHFVPRASDAAAVYGVGHSMGGASLLMAEILCSEEGGLFERLLLVEPIVMPTRVVLQRRRENPLAKAALRRRNGFRSLAEAREHYYLRQGSSNMFSTWHEEAFEQYLRGGLVCVSNGSDGKEGEAAVWKLRCDPVLEAAAFKADDAGAHYHLFKVKTKRVKLLYGKASDVYNARAADLILRNIEDNIRRSPDLQSFRIQAVEEATHFLPMEKLDLMAEEIVQLMLPNVQSKANL